MWFIIGKWYKWKLYEIFSVTQTFFHCLEQAIRQSKLVHWSGHVSRTRHVKFSRTDVSIGRSDTCASLVGYSLRQLRCQFTLTRRLHVMLSATFSIAVIWRVSSLPWSVIIEKRHWQSVSKSRGQKFHFAKNIRVWVCDTKQCTGARKRVAGSNAHESADRCGRASIIDERARR